MRRARRLRDSGDFYRVRRVGRSWADPRLVLFAAPGGSEATRVGISVSKRVGGAVVRNRLKRRIREIVNARYEKIESGWDIVVLVRPVAAAAGFHEIEAAVISLLSRAKLMSTESECAPSSGD